MEKERKKLRKTVREIHVEYMYRVKKNEGYTERMGIFDFGRYDTEL